MNEIHSVRRLFSTLSIRMEGTTYIVPVPIVVGFLLLVQGDSGHTAALLADAFAGSAFVFLLGLIKRRIDLRPFFEAVAHIENGSATFADKRTQTVFRNARIALLDLPVKESLSCVVRWFLAVASVGFLYTVQFGIPSAPFLGVLIFFGLFNGIVSVPFFFFGTELECAKALGLTQFIEAEGKQKHRISLRFRLSYTIMSLVLYAIGIFSFLILYINAGYIAREKTLESLVFLGIGAVILVTIILYFLARGIGEPVKAIDAALRTMNEDKGDLTARVPVRSQDDIGDLSESFNTFLSFLAISMKELSAAADLERELGSGLSATALKTSDATREISRTMESMDQSTRYLEKETRGAQMAASAIGKSVEEVISLIENQASAVNESSAAVVQTLANIASLERTASEKHGLVGRLKASGLEGQKSMASSIALIKEISDSTAVIVELIGVINAISRQTNLLAMNAAIEAAHAGDAGRGFSVVADEIRQLAESSGINAKKISQSLREIVSRIGNTARLTTETGKIIDSTLLGVGDVSSSLDEMLDGLKEMTIGSSQITEALTQLNQTTEKLRDSGRVMGQDASTINRSIETVLGLSEQNVKAIAEGNTGVAEIVRSMEILAELSVKNAKGIERIDGELIKFKT